MLSTTLCAVNVMKLFLMKQFVKSILIDFKHRGRRKKHSEDSKIFHIIVCVFRVADFTVGTVGRSFCPTRNS